MATNFPASLDSLTNPTSSDSLNSPSHSAQHANSNDAIEALQAKVGADSSAVTTSLDYKVAQLEAISHGKILQVLSTTKLDAFTTSSTSLVDVTGLSVSVTPSSTSSKVLVLAQVSVGAPTATNFGLQLVRDSTAIFISTAGSANATAQFQNHFGTATDTWTFVYLDSPASSSATTYKIQARCGTGSVKINEGSNTFYGATSSITVMEVSA